MTSSITVSVNDHDVVLAVDATVRTALDHLGTDGRGSAVARNAEVVPRSAWATTRLADGDRVEVLTVAQGG